MVHYFFFFGRFGKGSLDTLCHLIQDPFRSVSHRYGCYFRGFASLNLRLLLDPLLQGAPTLLEFSSTTRRLLLES